MSGQRANAPRVAVRAVIVVRGRILLVNAYAGAASDLWVPPGGGSETGTSLHANLAREVFEETGLRIRPGRLAGLSEFHNPETGFHQVDLLFRARLTGSGEAVLGDPEGVVNRLRWASEAELAQLRVKPGILPQVAFGPRGKLVHEDLDVMVS